MDFQTTDLIKYLLEGLSVAVAAYLIPRRTVSPQAIAMIAVTAAAIFMVLDQFSPLTAAGARQGAGFGIGYQNIAGGAIPGLEGFDDYE